MTLVFSKMVRGKIFKRLVMSSLAEIFSEPWAIFQSPRDSKVIKKDFGFQ